MAAAAQATSLRGLNAYVHPDRPAAGAQFHSVAKSRRFATRRRRYPPGGPSSPCHSHRIWCTLSRTLTLAGSYQQGCHPLAGRNPEPPPVPLRPDAPPGVRPINGLLTARQLAGGATNPPRASGAFHPVQPGSSGERPGSSGRAPPRPARWRARGRQTLAHVVPHQGRGADRPVPARRVCSSRGGVGVLEVAEGS